MSVQDALGATAAVTLFLAVILGGGLGASVETGSKLWARVFGTLLSIDLVAFLASVFAAIWWGVQP